MNTFGVISVICFYFNFATSQGKVIGNAGGYANGTYTSIGEKVEKIYEELSNFMGSIRDPLESSILSENPYYGQILKLWIGGSSKWKLCWRASKDGWGASERWKASVFHRNCDGKAPTVTIVKVGQYIFGGYTTASWEDLNTTTYGDRKKAPGTFLFSLRNKENLPPFKLHLLQDDNDNAIYADISVGPAFGCCYGLFISDNAAFNRKSETVLYSSYWRFPSSVKISDHQTILAGTTYFTPSEIEVLYRV